MFQYAVVWWCVGVNVFQYALLSWCVHRCIMKASLIMIPIYTINNVFEARICSLVVMQVSCTMKFCRYMDWSCISSGFALHYSTVILCINSSLLSLLHVCGVHIKECFQKNLLKTLKSKRWEASPLIVPVFCFQKIYQLVIFWKRFGYLVMVEMPVT